MSVSFKDSNSIILGAVLIFMVIVGCIMFSCPCVSHAESVDNARQVIYYSNRSDMMNGLLDSMGKHSLTVSVSYPGICNDFQTYKKDNYRDFFDRLSIRNGYNTGILSGYCVYVNSKDEYVTFQFNYVTTKRQEQYINRKVKKIVRKFKGKKKVTRIKGAHDYLVRHMQYDLSYHNPYYAFRKGRGLCMSYALAFQRLMNEMDIPCVYVKGKNHAWNKVKIGSVWYNVDVTWDDSEGSYRYFLKNNRDFPGHDMPASKHVRKLKMTRHSYFFRK